MRLGGNANAQSYFRKAGLTDLRTKIEKKYTSKAAQSYRIVLAKMVDAEAAKRGEAVEGTVEDVGTSLLESLALAEEHESVAKESIQTMATLATAKGTLASQNPNAKGTLRTPPTSGNAPKLLLRKPSSGNQINMLKKKPSNVGSKLRVNKISTTTSNNQEEEFEDVEKTQKAAEISEGNNQQIVPDSSVQNNCSIEPPPETDPTPNEPVQTNLSPTKSPGVSKQSLAQGVAKLQAMNSDFFSMT